MTEKEEWRTLTAKMPKEEYLFCTAYLKRIADANEVQPNTILYLIIRDHALALERQHLNPDFDPEPQPNEQPDPHSNP